MDISARAQNMPQSPIRKLAKYADAAKRNGIHIYHLNIGQPDIETPQCALDAVHNFHQPILDYSPSQGTKSLRTKMVSYYAEYGIDLSPDEIIITAGAQRQLCLPIWRVSTRGRNHCHRPELRQLYGICHLMRRSG